MKPYNKPDFDLIEFNVTDICNPSGLEPIPGWDAGVFCEDDDAQLYFYTDGDGNTVFFHDIDMNGDFDPGVDQLCPIFN